MATIQTGKKIYQEINIVNGDGVVIATIDNEASSSHYIPSIDSQGQCSIPSPISNRPTTLDVRIQNNTGRYVLIREGILKTESQGSAYERKEVGINPGAQISLSVEPQVQIDAFYDLYLNCDVSVRTEEQERFGMRINYVYNGNVIHQMGFYNPNSSILNQQGINMPFIPEYQSNILLITLI